MYLNHRLFRLYEKYWDDMIGSLKDNELGNPLLLNFRDEEKYEKADIKIMFLGQETNSWEGGLGSKDINELMETYSEFLEIRYGGQFWNAVRDYVRTIKDMNPNKSVEYVWNNIIKIGKEEGKGVPEQHLVNRQKEVFPVLREEIEIINPNLIIFFTGPYYDQYINKEWDELQFNEVNNSDKRQLAIVNHNLLPEITFRTYHPNYLYRRGKQFFGEIKDAIITN